MKSSLQVCAPPPRCRRPPCPRSRLPTRIYMTSMASLHTLLLITSVAATSSACAIVDPTRSTTVTFRDIHDGDYKQCSLAPDGELTIKPWNNTESWIIKAGPLDDACAAMVDFNVPGKPNPPPVRLKLKIFKTRTSKPVTSTRPAAVPHPCLTRTKSKIRAVPCSPCSRTPG